MPPPSARSPPPTRLSNGDPLPRGAARRAESPLSVRLETALETAVSPPVASRKACVGPGPALAATGPFSACPEQRPISVPAEPRRHPRCRRPAVRRLLALARLPLGGGKGGESSGGKAEPEPLGPCHRSAEPLRGAPPARQRRWLSASWAGVNRLTSGLSGRGRRLAVSSKKGASGSAAACLAPTAVGGTAGCGCEPCFSVPPRRTQDRVGERSAGRRATLCSGVQVWGPNSGTSITRPAAPKPILGSSIALNAHALTAKAPEPERYGQ